MQNTVPILMKKLGESMLTKTLLTNYGNWKAIVYDGNSMKIEVKMIIHGYKTQETLYAQTIRIPAEN